MRLSTSVPVFAALAVVAGFAGQAQAYHGYSVARHYRYQQFRIHQGVRSGALTPREDQHLEARENNIQRTAQADRAANGGTLTPGEKATLGARQAATSASIFVDKHNGATAAPGQ
jgi:hypothetical protein